MNLDVLLQKLIVIERAIGVVSDNTVRDMIYEAESCVLDMQCEAIAARGQLDHQASPHIPLLREIA